MPLTLTLTDLANNTGFAAAVAGTGGAAASVFLTPADRPWPGDAWILGGTRTGDGTVIVTVAPRFYFAYAATATECTPPGRVAATSGTASVAERVQASVAAQLALCALPRVGAQVYTQTLVDPTGVKYPCAVVHVENVSESEESSTNGTDDIVYPVNVLLLDSGVKLRSSNGPIRAWVQSCRQAVSRALRNVHLAGVPESVLVRVQPGPVAQERYGPDGMPWQFYAGGFVVKITCREPRGLGA